MPLGLTGILRSVGVLRTSAACYKSGPTPGLTCLWHLCQETVQSGPDLTASERRCNGSGSTSYGSHDVAPTNRGDVTVKSSTVLINSADANSTWPRSIQSRRPRAGRFIH